MDLKITKLTLRKILVLFLFLKMCAGIDLVQECESNDNGHVTRGYFTCCAASSRGLPLLSSLDLEDVWHRCAIGPQSLNVEDPVISAWRVYRCIVFSGLQGKPLRPTTFADLVTSKYPPVIRTKVLTAMSELEEEGAHFDVDVECLRRTPYPKVHLVRNLFYNAEQDICQNEESIKKSPHSSSNKTLSVQFSRNTKRSSKSSPFSSSDFSSILCETCDRSREMYHRNGDCCNHVPLPFPFLYLPIRYGNNDRVAQCTDDLIDDVGLPPDTTFATRLKYLCYPSCEYYLSGILTENDIWAGINIIQSQSDLRSLILKMMPKYFSQKYQDELQSFIIDNFQTAWAETPTFESKIKLSQRDIRNCDKGKLKNLLASCKAHRLVETMANLFLTELCQKQYPLESDQSLDSYNGTITPSPPYSSSEQDPEMIPLDFQWKRGGRSEDDVVEGRIKQYFANRNRSSQSQRSFSSRPAIGSSW